MDTSTNNNDENIETAANQVRNTFGNFIYSFLTWPAGQEHQQDENKRRHAITGGISIWFFAIYFGMKISEAWYSGNWQVDIICISILIIIARLIVQLIPIIIKFLRTIWRYLPTVFIWSAGADKATLDKGPKKESIKYVGLGMSMYVPAILGIITATYIGCEIFEMRYPILLSLLWGSIIFFIDRVLVVGMQRDENGKYEIGSMILRFMLAIVIGLVVATPIELVIFDREIKEQLAFERETQDKVFDADLEAEKAKVDKKIVAEEAKVQKLKTAYDLEINTSVGGRRPAHGKEATKKEAFWKEAKLRYETVILPELQKEKDDLVVKYKDKKASWVDTQAKGLGGRLEALNRTGERKPTVFYAHLLLWMFFLFLELVPVLVKWLMKPGPYEEAITAEAKNAKLQSQLSVETEKNTADKTRATLKTELDIVTDAEANKLKIATNRTKSELNQATAVHKLEKEGAIDLAKKKNTALMGRSSDVCERIC